MLASAPLSELPLPLAVVCHDTGGANQVIAMLRGHDLHALQLRPYMQGPAAYLWRNAFPVYPTCPDLADALDGAAALLCGTGWASDIEHQARRLARAAGIPSVAVLDHWVNYAARFSRGGMEVLPDEIWVTDTDAESLASAQFPATLVRRVQNCYLATQLAQLATTVPDNKPHILFLCEPAFSNWGRSTAGEFQALDYFLDKLAHIDALPSSTLLIRPHPSEPADKYVGWVESHAHLSVCLDTSADLAGAMRHARWVVGCQSYAMTVALAAGRKVFCALPPWAPPCVLPQQGIVHLKNL